MNYSEGMKGLMFDPSKFHEVGLYHVTDERSVDKALRDDVGLSFLQDYGKHFGWNTCLYLDFKRKSTRPALRRMMKHARAPKFELVLCETFAYLGTCQEMLEVLRMLSERHIECWSLSSLSATSFMDRVPRNISEVYDLIRDVDVDPEYADEIATIWRAVRDLNSARGTKSIEEARQQGKRIGRPADIGARAEITKLLEEHKSTAVIKATVNVSLATIYRMQKEWLKSKASGKPEIIDSGASCTTID